MTQESATAESQIYNTLNTTSMILDTIFSKLAPYECLGCAQEGSLICKACTHHLEPVPARCYRCHRISEGFRTCPSCRSHSELWSVLPVSIYDGIAKEIVWKLKFGGAQKAAQEMASFMKVLPFSPDNAVIVPVPTATSRARKRGYDQAVLLARALAQQTGLPYGACLRRLGQDEQLGARRDQRVTQLRHAYRCVAPQTVRDRHVLLIDDVLTTGATLEAAARLMKQAGAKHVSGIVFAQA